MLISHKNYLLKEKSKVNLNSEINQLSKIINEEINVLRNKNWENFTNHVNDNPLSSKKFWRRIDKIKNDGKDKKSYFPVMIMKSEEFNNEEFKKDIDKANLFGKILNETFKDNEDDKFDKIFKHNIDKEIKDYLNEKSNTSLIRECKLM
jgi:hypothetical protein